MKILLNRRRMMAGGAGAIAILGGLSVCRASSASASRWLGDFRRSGEDWTTTWLRALSEIEEGGELLVAAAIMPIESPLTIRSHNIAITASPGAVLMAAPDTSFEYLLSANKCHGLSLTGLSLDVNQAQRRSAQRHRFMGLGLVDCAQSSVSRLSVQGTLGFDDVPAVAVAVAGESRNIRLDQISVAACGTADQPSDGVYISGDDHLATRIVARNVTDTGVVLEACNRSHIRGVDVRDSSAAAAITNISPLPKSDNSITDLVGRNLNAPVTGWIQLGCPVQRAGDLRDSIISADLASDNGPGPAVNIRRQGAGQARGVTLNVQISGAQAQGILIDGQDVTVRAQIARCVGAGVQFQPGSSGTLADTSISGGTFGVLVGRGAKVTTSNSSYRDQRFWNMYVYRGGSVRSQSDRFGTAGINHYGQEQGATLVVG